MQVPHINQNPPTVKRNDRRRIVVESTPDTQPHQNKERRRQPDRRRKQVPISISERRKTKDRRHPKLLNARSAEPEKISSRKGRTIDTKV